MLAGQLARRRAPGAGGLRWLDGRGAAAGERRRRRARTFTAHFAAERARREAAPRAVPHRAGGAAHDAARLARRARVGPDRASDRVRLAARAGRDGAAGRLAARDRVRAGERRARLDPRLGGAPRQHRRLDPRRPLAPRADAAPRPPRAAAAAGGGRPARAPRRLWAASRSPTGCARATPTRPTAAAPWRCPGTRRSCCPAGPAATGWPSTPRRTRRRSGTPASLGCMRAHDARHPGADAAGAVGCPGRRGGLSERQLRAG